MTRDAERGLRFVAGMIAVLCAICGLAALLGAPAAGELFFGRAGMLLGMGAARALLPRRDWGSTGKTVLVFVAVGGCSPATASPSWTSPRGGGCSCGPVLRFLFLAVSRLTDPVPPRRTRG